MHIKKLGVAIVGIAAFTFICLYLGPRLNPVPPRNLTYGIAAGDVARGMVASASRLTGKMSFPVPPHHLEFSSSNGPVEISIVRFDLAAGADSIREMERMTSSVREGKALPNVLAHQVAQNGRIDLHWWPVGNVRYLVFLRPEQASEVTVVVHYAP